MDVFATLASTTDIYVITFAEMEELMVNSNGGCKERALRRALIIANELFTSNTKVKSALSNVKSFVEIEDALTVVSDDAGERVIFFFNMLFLNKSWDVDVLTNKTSVYTDRTIFASKEKLRAAINNISIEVFYDTFHVIS